MDLISEPDSGGSDLVFRALVVDDEAALADVVASYLHREHFRHKLADGPVNPRFVFTVRGVGYRMGTGE